MSWLVLIGNYRSFSSSLLSFFHLYPRSHQLITTWKTNLPPSMCSLHKDSGVINTFTHKTTVIPAFLQGSEVRDQAQQQQPLPLQHLVYERTAYLCLCCCYSGITFFYFSKSSVAAIRLYVSSQRDIKGGWGIPAVLSLCLLEKPRSVSWVKGSSQHLLSPWGGRSYRLSLCAVQHRGCEYYILLFNCDIKCGVPTAGESTYLMWQIFKLLLRPPSLTLESFHVLHKCVNTMEPLWKSNKYLKSQ